LPNNLKVILVAAFLVSASIVTRLVPLSIFYNNCNRPALFSGFLFKQQADTFAAMP
jgi:hypothetical protein